MPISHIHIYLRPYHEPLTNNPNQNIDNEDQTACSLTTFCIVNAFLTAAYVVFYIGNQTICQKAEQAFFYECTRLKPIPVSDLTKDDIVLRLSLVCLIVQVGFICSQLSSSSTANRIWSRFTISNSELNNTHLLHTEP